MGLFFLISFLIVNSIGSLYPVYLSYKAIKNNDTQALEVLLMFWVVMGVITVLENTFGWLVNWIPLFYQCKCLFMLWLTLPQIQGSTHIYVTYVHPFLLEHEAQIDKGLIELKLNFKRWIESLLSQVVDKVRETASTAVSNYTPSQQSKPNEPPPVPENQTIASNTANLIWQVINSSPAILNYYRPTTAPINHPLNPTNPISRETTDGYRIPDYDEMPLSNNPTSKSGIRRRNLSNNSIKSLLSKNCGRSNQGFRENGGEEGELLKSKNSNGYMGFEEIDSEDGEVGFDESQGRLVDERVPFVVERGSSTSKSSWFKWK
ncbi:TB2/DP1, HVA22 family-domain-containing protein [Phakopsora pachyrhizi]|uniref:Protein YOP1 n=1 Tax=Phakopsora pachyrhizi TaxID=170000 RepID=A0AAV0ATJ3_PHAPC|nr:TB2/DP1, HVA22 family-domain-containing protein [Phakopsora pachyrhizi]CAH7671887.1 TB2/DP1, HVA22 family-domain-containing protein [Phakopsora pachyrhizi]